MSDAELTEEEKFVILRSMQCLHHLKYISDIPIESQKTNELLKILVEEVVKIREALNDR